MVSSGWADDAPLAGHAARLDRSAQRLEGSAQLGAEQPGLLPGGEVAALVELVVVDEIGIGPLGPVAGRLVELIREDAHRGWDLDALGTEEGELVLPIEASRRNRGVRQPEQRDVVEDVVRCDAFGL